MKENSSHFGKGNQLWKTRAKSGRDAIFQTPQALWIAACEYFKWVDENPLNDHEWKTEDKELTQVENPKMRPYTIIGLCIFCHVNSAYFRKFKQNLRDKQERLEMEDEVNKEQLKVISDFNTVIETIEEIIYQQKFEGAATGLMNANIISRDLGLADKKEIAANINLTDKPIEFE